MDTKALRQKILDLAIRGKLVPQNPDDEPASVLLEKIRAEKQQMVKDGKLKAKDIKNDTAIYKGEDNLHYEKFQDGTVKCIEDEIPFDLPEGWEWARFRNIVSLKSGTTYPAESECVSGAKLYVKVADMNLPENSYEIKTSTRFLNDFNPAHLIPVGSVIFPKRGGAILTNKKRLVLQDSILVDLNTMSFTPYEHLNLLFCYYWFLSIDLGQLNNGSNVPQINNIDIEPLLFPVPPHHEQERIVDKLVEVMPLISNIEDEQDAMCDAISKTKSKILDLAIRGKLVPQNPNDEPTSVMLERIRAEKEALINAGKLKRDKKESVIFRGEDNSYYEKINGRCSCIDSEIPFEIPNSWVWCRGTSCFAGMTAKKPTGEFFDYIDIDSVDNVNHRVSTPKHLACVDSPSRANRAVQEGSVVFSLVRPYLENIAYIDATLKDCIASTGFYICNSNGVFYPPFMYYLMISRYVVDGLNQFMKGDNSPSISKDNLEHWLYPVPPYQEQIIVAQKIKALMNPLGQIERSFI